MIGLWTLAQRYNYDIAGLYDYVLNWMHRRQNYGFPGPYDGNMTKNVCDAGFHEAPSLTVALPLWKSKNIAWLALESLIRQRDVNYHWELVVLEEEEEQFGKERLFEYANKLERVGCTRIVHLSIDKWMPLPMKWKTIHRNATKTSKYFLLQAGDCYSYPWRLRDSYYMFEKGADWINSAKGIFYYIQEDFASMYDSTLELSSKRVGLNMGCRMDLLTKFPDDHRRKGIDGFLWLICRNNKGSPLNIKWTTNHWQTGFDSHGMNHISYNRDNSMRAFKPPFCKLPPTEKNFKKYIPTSVLDRLMKIPLMSKEKEPDFYDKIYREGGHNQTYFKKAEEIEAYYPLWKYAYEYIRENNMQRITDLGCGPGHFATLFKDSDGVQYTGLDFSEEAIKQAESKNQNKHKKFYCKDLRNIELRDCDVYTCFEVLEHIQEDINLIKKIKQGHVLLFSVPNYDSSGHVRFFPNYKSIEERYGSIFNLKLIQTVSLGNDAKIFLCYGVRK